MDQFPLKNGAMRKGHAYIIGTTEVFASGCSICPRVARWPIFGSGAKNAPEHTRHSFKRPQDAASGRGRTTIDAVKNLQHF